MAEYDYDLFVIGAGSGGVRAARIASQHGAKVAIAEEYRYGGTCVIRGCVPKKILVYASRFRDDFEDSAGFGWSFKGDATFDWATLIANKDREIDRLEGIYKSLLERANIDAFSERAEFEDAHTIRLTSSGRLVTADKILVATGGKVNYGPVIPGIEHVMSSNEAFHLEEFPKRIVIKGGGYIAVEFASIFNGLGADVTLTYRGEKILRGFDEDMRDGLTEAMRERGIKICTNVVVNSIEKQSDGSLKATLSDGQVLDTDQVMYAIGRDPHTAGLGLEKAGVELGPRGEVKVSAESQSNVENIYAVGDVTDRVALTPVAIREGHAFADSVFGKSQRTVSHEKIATAVFSTPEIGTCGLTEAAARARYPSIDIYKSQFRPMRNTISG
ncbi:MAG: glutathione-disulfide reductase, partial [Alphaproteobacteria bacterium]|nr:glutathione-disulfide reductase [Alphaproteobacteria bacterium]